MEDKKKKKRFRLFDSQREGKGVSKEDANITPDLRGFWRGLRRDLSRLVRVNLLIVLGNFPIVFALIALSGVFNQKYAAPVSDLFQSLHALSLLEGGSASPALFARIGIDGLQYSASAMTTLTYVFYGLAALVIFTFGCVNVGVAYLIRNMIKGEPVFIWSDFWYAIKNNFRQAFFFGILDAFLLFLIPFNIISLLGGGNLFTSIMFWMTIVIGILYFFMRFYIYLQMVTFDLSLWKILKNSLIFSLLGIKRNLMALLGIILLLFIEYFCIFVGYSMGLQGLLIPLGIALPLIIMFAVGAYMATFAAYFKVKEIMIDPQMRPNEEVAATDLE